MKLSGEILKMILRLNRLPEDVFLTAETQSKAGAEEEEKAAFVEKLFLNDQQEDDGPVLIALIWNLKLLLCC